MPDTQTSIVPTDETIPVELPDGRIVNVPVELEEQMEMPLRGIFLRTVDEAAREGRGSQFDVVRVCVAMLRAAGLPARSVYGIQATSELDECFVAWGEFWLPDSGWIPFDPQIMRGQTALNQPVTAPWPGFGTINDLNQRVPLAYSWLSADNTAQPDAVALWSWGGTNQLPSLSQQVNVNVAITGPGRPDPE